MIIKITLILLIKIINFSKSEYLESRINFSLVAKVSQTYHLKVKIYVTKSLIDNLRKEKIFYLSYLKNIIHETSKIFIWHGILIYVIDTEYWPLGDKFIVENSFESNLESLKKYTHQQKHPQIDSHALLRDIGGSSSTIGYAYVGICRKLAVLSAEVGKECEYDPKKCALVFAHELTHNLGSVHYTPSTCSCANKNNLCLMLPKLFSPPKNHQTIMHKCSVQDIINSVGKFHNCMITPPKPNEFKKIFSSCGNNILDEGEECDCGDVMVCEYNGKSSCCNATTCMFKSPQFQCFEGPCCQDCMFKKSGLCRYRRDNCDYTDYCTGESNECIDFYKPDGINCGNNSLCVNGKCPDKNDQCRKLVGPGPRFIKYSESCDSEMNAIFSQENCDNLPVTHNYICNEGSGICGAIYCEGDQKDLNYGIMITEISRRNQSSLYCLSAGMDDQLLNYGLIADGTECGTNKVCFEKKCIDKAKFHQPCNGIKCELGAILSSECECFKLVKDTYVKQRKKNLKEHSINGNALQSDRDNRSINTSNFASFQNMSDMFPLTVTLSMNNITKNTQHQASENGSEWLRVEINAETIKHEDTGSTKMSIFSDVGDDRRTNIKTRPYNQQLNYLSIFRNVSLYALSM